MVRLPERTMGSPEPKRPSKWPNLGWDSGTTSPRDEHQRIPDGLGSSPDRCRGGTVGSEGFQYLGQGLFGGPPGDDPVEAVGVGHPGIAGAEVFGVQQVRALDGVEHACRKLVRGRADREVPVGRTERAERREPGNVGAGAQREAHGFKGVEGLAGHHRGQRAEHRHVHVLSLAGVLSLQQSTQGADDREQRSGQVTDRQAKAHRRLPRLPGGHHHAAERLDDGVHRLAGPRSPCRRRNR